MPAGRAARRYYAAGSGLNSGPCRWHAACTAADPEQPGSIRDRNDTIDGAAHDLTGVGSGPIDAFVHALDAVASAAIRAAD